MLLMALLPPVLRANLETRHKVGINWIVKFWQSVESRKCKRIRQGEIRENGICGPTFVGEATNWCPNKFAVNVETEV